MDVIDPQMPQIVKMLLAMAIVLGLMAGLSILLKKLGLSAVANIKPSDKRRLSIVESLPLDARRRLVILRCDQSEHLVILGGNDETVIETNIPPATQSVDTLENSEATT